MTAADDPSPVNPTKELFRTINRFVKPAVKAGLGSPLPVGLGAVVLESTGRKSGLAREVPVLGFRVGKKVYISTVRERSQWLKNLEASDKAGVWYCGSRKDATACVQRGPLNVVTLEVAPEGE
ncbi:MAG: nitroreductase/quinone reductase family protein [Acidimicrobiia bacterium]|nr:nitroreductase/quinone reductase family protein [Acidimicrobiia bacterium]